MHAQPVDCAVIRVPVAARGIEEVVFYSGRAPERFAPHYLPGILFSRGADFILNDGIAQRTLVQLPSNECLHLPSQALDAVCLRFSPGALALRFERSLSSMDAVTTLDALLPAADDFSSDLNIGAAAPKVLICDLLKYFGNPYYAGHRQMVTLLEWHAAMERDGKGFMDGLPAAEKLAMRRLFSRYTGLSPYRYFRVLRARRVLIDLDRGAAADELVRHWGYSSTGQLRQELSVMFDAPWDELLTLLRDQRLHLSTPNPGGTKYLI